MHDFLRIFALRRTFSRSMVVFGQIIFVVYMILVTLLLVNMLIAMMGHTYETVNESQKEWYRQVR